MTIRRSPDLTTIAGRIKAERQRIALSQSAMAAIGGVKKSAQISWENGKSAPNAVALAAFSDAGADVLFIVTGRREGAPPAAPQGLSGVTVRQALAMLDPVDRHRLLLDLLAEELRG